MSNLDLSDDVRVRISGRTAGSEWLREKPPSLDATRIGLAAIYIGAIAVVVAYFVRLMGFLTPGTVNMFSPSATGLLTESLSAVLIIGSVVATCFGIVLILVGAVCCFAAPKDVGGKGLLIVFLICHFLAVTFIPVAAFFPGVIPPLAPMIVVGIAIGSYVLLIRFLCRVCRFIYEESLAQPARAATIAVLVAAVLPTAGATVSRYDMPQELALLAIVTLGPLAQGAMITFGLLLFANFVNKLRNAVRGPAIAQITAIQSEQ
jgi:hypothetical protein